MLATVSIAALAIGLLSALLAGYVPGRRWARLAVFVLLAALVFLALIVTGIILAAQGHVAPGSAGVPAWLFLATGALATWLQKRRR